MKWLASILGLIAVFSFFSEAILLADSSLAFNGYGQDDIVVYHAATGSWYIRNPVTGEAEVFNLGGAEWQPVLGDYDGDGMPDVAAYNTVTGNWMIRYSSTGLSQTIPMGGAGEKPVPGDYDGDGITDLAVYERASGNWRIRLSSTGQDLVRNFGWPDVRPVPADYDGDGITDLAVYHRQPGMWYILGSSDGFQAVQFGYANVRPVPADYDGDGRADLAVYDRGSGFWYILGSLDGFRTQQFGYSKTRPAPADYDGDGLADLALYERETGNWYLMQSSEGFRMLNWGWRQATPLPAYRNGGSEGMIILSFGDSITYGTSSACNCPLTGYPALLEQRAGPALGGHYTLINAGVPGETTRDGANRIKQWLQWVQPDVTILMEATNDHVFGVPFGSIESNLRSMIDQAQAAGSQVILATTPPVISNQFRNRGAQMARIQQFNPRIYQIAASTGARVAPIYEAMTSMPNWQNALMDQPTANHPNDAGYRVLRDTFLKTIEDGLVDGLFW